MSDSEGDGGNPKGEKQHMSKEDCDTVQTLLNSKYHDKVTQKLRQQYDAIPSNLDGRLVKQVLSGIGFTGFALLSGCRPASVLRIEGGDLEVLISNHSSDNVGEDDLEEGILEDGDVAICINFNQSKTRVPFEELLFAEFQWEKDIIELIHAVLSDDRLGNIGADGLLFDVGATDRNGLKTSFVYSRLARTVLTTAAFECNVTVDVNFELLRKLYACLTLQNMLEGFDIGKCSPGSGSLRRLCANHVRSSLKDVSKRLGHTVDRKYRARKVAPYVDPRFLVEFAHYYGYHRFSLAPVRGLIKVDGADHPWLSDSDEDDDDYKKAEDDFVFVRGGQPEEDDGDY